MNLLKVPEVAERLNCSESFVYEVIASGELKHYRLGKGQGGIRLGEAQLAEFLSKREKGGQPVPATPLPQKRVKLRHLDV
jgi:excisionase family DNA binding protein